MRFIYVLEDEIRFQKEITEALLAVDPTVQVRIFVSTADFVTWLQAAATVGAPALLTGGLPPEGFTFEPVSGTEHQLSLVVSKLELLGTEQLGLLRKARETFLQKTFCTEADPTSFVLTAFSDPDFRIRAFEDKILSNVIFKPFDKLILLQHITFALDGRHPPSKYSIANQKTEANIEMLKAVDIEVLSDVGFVTRSDRQLVVGAVSKYYCTLFVTDKERSVMAVCISCTKHPFDQNLFQGKFLFFGLSQAQISSIRRQTRDKKALNVKADWPAPVLGKMAEPHFVVIDEEENTPAGVVGYLQKRYSPSRVTYYTHFGLFYMDFDPNAAFKDRSAAKKAFPSSSVWGLKFNARGEIFLGATGDIKDPVLFGEKESDLKNKNNWFISAMLDSHRTKFRGMLANGLKPTDDPIFELTMDGERYWIRFIELGKIEGMVEAKFQECTKEEAIAWVSKSNPLSHPVHAIFLADRYLSETPKDRWAPLLDICQQKWGHKPLIFVLGKRSFTDDQERSLATFCVDLLFKPVDRAYLSEKLASYFSFLAPVGDVVEVKSISTDKVLKVANPVKITQLSEAGIVMEYPRAINIGSFREFMLWEPEDLEGPELIATNNYVEETGDKEKKFLNHFVFFGVTDYFLKKIRVWIRDNYISSKTKG